MSSDSEGEQGLSLDAVFTEPPRPPSPEPTVVTYVRERIGTHKAANVDDWEKIDIRLVGSHPLWGHYLWNAARAFATYLDERQELYRGRAVLELGAGGGLPSLVTAKNGAQLAVVTDYPDATLMNNLNHNVQSNITLQTASRVRVEGYIWGQPVSRLLELQREATGSDGYDLIIMSDLIFNHSQHDALLRTSEEALSKRPSGSTEAPVPALLVFYTHHRPHLAHRDMEFFSKARDRGWLCEEILTRKFPPMFPEDPGEEEVRATVHGWRLTRTASHV
ncbi:hypothetical protein CERSUDRAFT_109118 [Gelatoporia subvermispora B]|uniref:Protein N-terminal and lysine N-methyltransferase EFM7 n=1 Tax=Ceriporiopsis subvermispora (strain B) TaxID=914234 RepID=M2QZH6_CERS8|nr:hypothetical protein CERSUDRAFT_109118 [Gelatoporia subvermispora B]